MDNCDSSEITHVSQRRLTSFTSTTHYYSANLTSFHHYLPQTYQLHACIAITMLHIILFSKFNYFLCVLQKRELKETFNLNSNIEGHFCVICTNIRHKKRTYFIFSNDTTNHQCNRMDISSIYMCVVDKGKLEMSQVT